MDVRLTVVSGKTDKQSIVLQLPVVIGRGNQSNLTIAHPMVSRRHCEICETDGQVTVRDLGSLNGTIVGGQQITVAPLQPNDQFTVGPLTFQVQFSQASQEPHFASATLAKPGAKTKAHQQRANPPAPAVSSANGRVSHRSGSDEIEEVDLLDVIESEIPANHRTPARSASASSSSSLETLFRQLNC